MSQEITEGTPPNQLTFTFPDDWELCKFDDTTFYRNRVEKLDGIKSVDIIAKSNDSLQFIEIKDFRHHRIENQARQRNGELLIEVSQKFVSTVASLIGANRCGIIDFEPYYTPLLSGNQQKIEVILFLERDESESILRQKKLLLADLKQKLKKLLVAYNVQCKVYDRENLPMEWGVR